MSETDLTQVLIDIYLSKIKLEIPHMIIDDHVEVNSYTTKNIHGSESLGLVHKKAQVLFEFKNFDRLLGDDQAKMVTIDDAYYVKNAYTIPLGKRRTIDVNNVLELVDAWNDHITKWQNIRKLIDKI